MGEETRFQPGDEAPNNGFYTEIGEGHHVSSVQDPQIIHMQRGDRFPETTNKNRQWTLHKK